MPTGTGDDGQSIFIVHHLGELFDVAETPPADGQVLVWDAAARGGLGGWKPGAGGGGGTPGVGDHATLFTDGSQDGNSRLIWQSVSGAESSPGTSIDVSGLPKATIPVAKGSYLITADFHASGATGGAIEVGTINTYSDRLRGIAVGYNAVSTALTTEDGADSIYVDPLSAVTDGAGIRIVRVA